MPRPSSLVSAAALAAVLSMPSSGQDVWSPMPGLGPDARDGHAMAYDSVRGVVVLFGGDDGTSALGDTWEWDGKVWTQVVTAGPSARARHAMAFDTANGVTLLFGGDDGGAHLGDTWQWDGNVWTQVATTGPSPRAEHAMAFDGQSDRVVLFGGADATSLFGGTWQWSGSAWGQVASTGPSARRGTAMACDELRGELVLFGGADASAALGDTWAWSGGAWTLRAASGPAARSDHALVFDPLRTRAILFGGDSGGGAYLSDVWVWDGSVWSSSAVTGPSARAGHAMAYDAGLRRVTLFGGRDASASGETWLLRCTPWCDLGFATAGTHGSPLLVGQGALEDGGSMTLTLSNVLAQTPAALLAGGSALHSPLLGSTLVPNPVIALPVPTLGTAGTPSTVTIGPLPVPTGTVSGDTLYFQYWIADPVGPFGLAVSNAVVGTTQLTLRAEYKAVFTANLAAAAAPATSKPIYTTQDFTNLIFVRNPACWAAGIDLTGISPWNQAHANTRAGTLVSPRHIVFAKHYPVSTTPGNNDIVFVTRDNVTVTREIVSVTYPAADIGVGLLDADVPPDITYYKILPQDWATHLPNVNNLGMLHLDQEEKALVRNMQQMQSGASYCWHITPPNPTRNQFSETLIGGDSGNPAFLILNGEAILILTHHFATGGPFYTTHRDAVNAAMTQLGGGYQLTEVDLSLIPR